MPLTDEEIAERWPGRTIYTDPHTGKRYVLGTSEGDPMIPVDSDFGVDLSDVSRKIDTSINDLLNKL